MADVTTRPDTGQDPRRRDRLEEIWLDHGPRDYDGFIADLKEARPVVAEAVMATLDAILASYNRIDTGTDADVEGAARR